MIHLIISSTQSSIRLINEFSIFVQMQKELLQWVLQLHGHSSRLLRQGSCLVERLCLLLRDINGKSLM